VQHFNAVLLHDSLPATDCTDWWSYPILYLLFNFLKSLGIICTEGQKILIIPMPMFTVLSLWQGQCKSSLGSFDECRLSVKQPSTLRPNQQTWAVSPPVGCHHLHPPSPFIITTQPEDRYSFYYSTESSTLSWPKSLSDLIASKYVTESGFYSQSP